MSIPEPAAALANQANALFVDEDFDGALDLYNQAITAASNCAELYVSRAALHIKMENFTAAISDANKAISIDPSNSKAYLRKGVACFQMEEYATAKNAFEKGKEIDPETAQFKTWIRKCNAELEEEMAVEEGSAAPIVVSPAVVDAPKTVAAASIPTSAPAPKPVQRFRHDFIQNQTHVTISVYLKGATKENCQIEFESHSLSLDWKISKDDSWQLSFDPLFDEIVPSESSANYFSTKVEIKLKKKNSGKWDALERKQDEKALDELTEEVGYLINFCDKDASSFIWGILQEIKRRRDYYPSSKAQGGQAKNWDRIVNEIPEDKLEGEEALNSFFQQIYGRGNEEVLSLFLYTVFSLSSSITIKSCACDRISDYQNVFFFFRLVEQ